MRGVRGAIEERRAACSLRHTLRRAVRQRRVMQGKDTGSLRNVRRRGGRGEHEV
jgi:hypothetical protein